MPDFVAYERIYTPDQSCSWCDVTKKLFDSGHSMRPPVYLIFGDILNKEGKPSREYLGSACVECREALQFEHEAERVVP